MGELATPMAIIGMGCRWPGEADSPSKLWDLLIHSRSGQSKVPADRVNIHGFLRPANQESGKRGTGSVAGDGGYFVSGNVFDFEPEFFGISPAEAINMDPMQRKLLEVTYECFENAGLTLEELKGSDTGCFVGNFGWDYWRTVSKSSEEIPLYAVTGVTQTILSNRLNYVFDLHGPSMTIDTACSSSMYALDSACGAIERGACRAAVVAGTNLILGPDQLLESSRLGVLSPTSTCHTFDVSANGYARADGFGAILIKRLSDAISDGDHIQAVIRSTAVNATGMGKGRGITNPDAKSQEQVIRKAYQKAGIEERSFGETGYFECHGTGTPVGDPEEVTAIGNVFARAHPLESPLLIGSIKPNLGHSEGASALASIMKVVLSFENGVIPPTIGIQTINPALPLHGGRIRIVTQPISLPKHCLRASVNSFGYGGANGHVILERPDSFVTKFVNQGLNDLLRQSLLRQIPCENGGLTMVNGKHSSSLEKEEGNGITPTSHRESNQKPQRFLLPFSAYSTKSLTQLISQTLENLQSYDLHDLAHILTSRRSLFQARAFVISGCNSQDSPQYSTVTEKRNTVAFIFTGQGAQWSGMGSVLLDRFPVFSDTIDKLDIALNQLSKPPAWSLRDVIKSPDYPGINNPDISQPSCTAIQIALVDLLRSWNIIPTAVLGHSSGEIAAAYAAGRVSQPEAIVNAYLRGKAAAESTSDGLMLAVGLDEETVSTYITGTDLGDRVSVACHNSPSSITLSGDAAAVIVLKQEFDSSGVFSRVLRTGGKAYHSHHMIPVAERYGDLLRTHCPKEDNDNAKVAHMVSSVSGDALPENSKLGTAYWMENLTNPVHFRQAVQKLLQGPEFDAIIEIGPHKVLESPVREIQDFLSTGATHDYISTLIRGTDGEESLLKLAGRLYLHGYPVNLLAVNPLAEGGRSGTINNLPSYPWNYEHGSKISESRLSSEWRFRKYPRHELLGSRLPGGSSISPTWRNVLHLSEIPWLEHHRLGEDPVFPAAGYLCMAMEAISQIYETEKKSLPVGVAFREVSFKSPLLLRSSNEGNEVLLALSPASRGSVQNFGFEFRVTSFHDGIEVEHCNGGAHVEHATSLPQDQCLPYSEKLGKGNADQWYRKLERFGLCYGPNFRRIGDLRVQRGVCEASAKLEISQASGHLSQRYILHPAEIDNMLQMTVVAAHAGSLDTVTKGWVPSGIGHASFRYFEGVRSQSCALDCRAKSKVGLRAFTAECAVCEEGKIVATIHDLTVIGADLISPRNESHQRVPYSRMLWKPDIDSVHSDIAARVLSTSTDTQESTLDSGKNPGPHKQEIFNILKRTLALTAHKYNSMDVLLAMDDLGGLDLARVVADALKMHEVLRLGRTITLASASSQILQEAQEEFKSLRFIHFHHLSEHVTEGEVVHEYDFIIFKKDTREAINSDILRLVRNLRRKGRIFVVASKEGHELEPTSSDEGTGDVQSLISKELGWTLHPQFTAHGTVQDDMQMTLYKEAAEPEASRSESQTLFVAFRESSEQPLLSAVQEAAHSIGWNCEAVPLTQVALKSKNLGSNRFHVVVAVELEGNMMTAPSSSEWEAVKWICDQAGSAIWLTKGDLIVGKDPSSAVISGIARAAMMENPRLQFSHLDLDEVAGHEDAIARQIVSIVTQAEMGLLSYTDYNFRIHNGIKHVSRVYPDYRLNAEFQLAKNKANGKTELLKPETPVTLDMSRLIPGSLDSICFKEDIDAVLPLRNGQVEVQTKAIGLNMKDVLILMGNFDQPFFYHECTGVVTRVGPEVTDLKQGDRVVALSKGAFGTHLRTEEYLCARILDTESFEDMATMPTVLGTAVHSLINFAGLTSGETVLITAGAGGLGCAAIQVAKTIGAKIFVTASTKEKRTFLSDVMGIPTSQIFNSRDKSFIRGVMAATNERGVDVILSSVNGELLDETWRCIAPGGRFIDVGRKDAEDSSRIEMRPFKRNASFYSFDLSRYVDNPQLISRLLSQVLSAIRTTSISPIRPMQVISISELVPVARQFMEGTHMGKFVISYDRPNTTVKFAPNISTVEFSSQASYLLVGGLGGLGRSLASWMCSRGATELIFLSRSERLSTAAQETISVLESQGVLVTIIKGDVSVHADVEKAFSAASNPIKGVFQGAMALADGLLADMSLEGFMTPMRGKTQGTINLHEVSIEQGISLDFFVMMSSISGTTGPAYQANYASANSFLDHFARYRRSQGLPASSVGIGAVHDVGYVHEHEDIKQNLLRVGVNGIPEEEFLRAMELAIMEQHNEGGFQDDDDPFAAAHLLTGMEPFELLKARGIHAGDWRAADARLGIVYHAMREISEAATTSTPGGETETSTTSDKVMKKVSEMHQIPLEKIREAASFLHLDSFMATEMRQWLYKELGVELSFVELLSQTMTVHGLIEMIEKARAG